MIDLHVHSNVSDGALAPVDIVDRAAKVGVAALAICDHDTVEAFSPELFSHARRKGVELVTGIEFSAARSDGRRTYHIVGLMLKHDDKVLLGTIAGSLRNRQDYARKAIESLERAGFVVNAAGIRLGTVTKARIVRALLHEARNADQLKREFGRMPTEGRFIESYMLPDQRCFVARRGVLSPAAAIEAIHAAGGLAFLAHPAYYVMRGEPLEHLCDELRGWGLDGLETYSIQFDRSRDDLEVDLSKECAEYCGRHGLLQSGGSDFHTDDTAMIGKHIDVGFANHPMKVPDALLAAMKRRLFEAKRPGC